MPQAGVHSARLGEWIVAVDVGGTFTDVMARRSDGEVRVVKVLSQPDDPASSFLEAVRRLSDDGVPLERVRLAFYGTTIATNALLTGSLARVALVSTAGFGDLLTYRDGRRDHIYDLSEARHPEWVAEADRIEVHERLSWEGKQLVPLTEVEVRRIADEIAQRQPESVAVALLFSYLDDGNERRIAEAIARRQPRVPVTTSAATAREIREYPRTATAVLNAALRPVVEQALGQVGRTLDSLGVAAPLVVMQSNGGCVPADRAAAQAHRLALSGPAGGVAGAVALGGLYGIDHLISVDMGGTSLDVCLVSDGAVPVRPSRKIEGFQVLCASVDVVAVGAGGGSIAWADRAGRLHIGPQSAGAMPGPAAYGRGGREPTVTDAHVVAGSLPHELLLGGSLPLDRPAAEEAIGLLAEKVGLETPELAAGVIAVTVAQMVGAVRRVSVEQGLDPREYTLVVFGGAGPMHAGLLLRELGARGVVIPAHPGLFAASGLLASDLRIDESQTVLRRLDDEALDEMRAWFETVGAGMRQRLREDGVPSKRIRLLASADCRFVGQGYELNVPLGRANARSLAALREDFCALHLATYGHADKTEQVELVNLRLSAFGGLDSHAATLLEEGPRKPSSGSVIGQTALRLGDGPLTRPAPVLDRSRLRAGNEVRGPAVIHQLDSTILVCERQRARVDRFGSIWLEETGSRRASTK